MSNQTDFEMLLDSEKRQNIYNYLMGRIRKTYISQGYATNIAEELAKKEFEEDCKFYLRDRAELVLDLLNGKPAPKSEAPANLRNTKVVSETIDGITFTSLNALANHFHVKPSSVYNRYDKGLRGKDLLVPMKKTTPKIKVPTLKVDDVVPVEPLNQNIELEEQEVIQEPIAQTEDNDLLQSIKDFSIALFRQGFVDARVFPLAEKAKALYADLKALG